MTDESLARMRSHRNNIRRYRQLLRTRLSELERQYIERRLSEEEVSPSGPHQYRPPSQPDVAEERFHERKQLASGSRTWRVMQ
jgi:hypothetical protein